tara:strand:+ start:972 stop:1595 length:624 start_codon:yes stop_codon:yes gene_type:complete
MDLPDIEIPEIAIQTIIDFSKPVDLIPLTISVPACTYQHRDIKNTGNRNLLLEDPNGVFTVCDAPFPSFNPMDYQPNNLIMSEDTPINMSEPEIPETKPITNNSEPEVEEFFIKCPDPEKDQRIGDFRNDKRLERVIGHKLNEDGNKCITLYENTSFAEQYIPNVPSITNAAAIAVVAASTPILINLVKPLVKQIFNKLTKKKNKVK